MLGINGLPTDRSLYNVRQCWYKKNFSHYSIRYYFGEELQLENSRTTIGHNWPQKTRTLLGSGHKVFVDCCAHCGRDCVPSLPIDSNPFESTPKPENKQRTKPCVHWPPRSPQSVAIGGQRPQSARSQFAAAFRLTFMVFIYRQYWRIVFILFLLFSNLFIFNHFISFAFCSLFREESKD